MENDASVTRCQFEGCPATVPNHYWGRVKAEDWFFQRDGKAWCGDHIPEWVEKWRDARASRGSKTRDLTDKEIRREYYGEFTDEV